MTSSADDVRRFAKFRDSLKEGTGDLAGLVSATTAGGIFLSSGMTLGPPISSLDFSSRFGDAGVERSSAIGGGESGGGGRNSVRSGR